MYRFVSICIDMYRYVSIPMYRYVSICIDMYRYVSICIDMYRFVSICIFFVTPNEFLPKEARGHSILSTCTYVSLDLVVETYIVPEKGNIGKLIPVQIGHVMNHLR
jgi:hypothetical protein